MSRCSGWPTNHVSRGLHVDQRGGLRARVHEATAGSYGIGVEWLRQLADECELPMSAEHLVRVIHALIEGLVLQRILTAKLCPDEVFFTTFAALGNHRRDANLDAQ
jgi:hypothetical protein